MVSTYSRFVQIMKESFNNENMKKQFSKTGKYLYVISLLLLITSCVSNNSIGQKGGLKIELSEQTYKLWAYWWWMGSFEHSAKTFRLIEIDLNVANNINEFTKDIEGAKLIHLSTQGKNGKYEDITGSVQQDGRIQHTASLKKAGSIGTKYHSFIIKNYDNSIKYKGNGA